MNNLWIAFTLLAAGAQTARNAMQRDLIGTLGAPGATTVRFLFGLPFVLAFVGALSLVRGHVPPLPHAATLAWTTIGALAQIAATGLMLMAMQGRSFVVAIAYTKTEPVFVALFGLAALGDRVTVALAAAIGLATAGVMLMSWPRTGGNAAERSLQPALWGVASAALFAVSAVGFRAAILSLHANDFVLAAATPLILSLTFQSALIVATLALADRPLLAAIAREWRPSLFAGFMGALASQFWFLAFAIDSAARVRTLGLVEILFAQIVSRKIFGQRSSFRELGGIALMAAGVALLVA